MPNNINEKLRHYAGLLMIILGTLLLALTRWQALAHSNTLLMAGLLCIVAGIAAHVWSIKHESRY